MKILNRDVHDGDTATVNIPLFYLHGTFQEDALKDIHPNYVDCGDEQWPVVDGEFKMFHELQQGENVIALQWMDDGEQKFEFKVNYVQDDNRR